MKGYHQTSGWRGGKGEDEGEQKSGIMVAGGPDMSDKAVSSIDLKIFLG